MSHSVRTGLLLLILAGPLLVLWGCRKQPRAPVMPPPPNYLQLGENYFESGDYANAAQAYENYLRAPTSSNARDRVLFLLALAYAFPGSPVRDLPRARQLLQQLVSSFPKSPLKPEAEYLLRLQEEVDRLRLDLTKRNERIKELTQELEKLKQIDMERRRPRVP